MENHKFHYLQQFLNHKRPSTTLQDCAKACVRMLKGCEEKARECYADDIKLTSDEFVEMMMLDGCFIVELFLRNWSHDHSQKLWEISFLNLALKFFNCNEEDASTLENPNHLLDLKYKTTIPSQIRTNDGESLGGDGAPRTLPTATQLREAGVKFKAAPPGTHLLDIKFQNKTLEIPTIQVEDQTEPLFRNMIAYEQCYGETSYMVDYFSIVIDDLISSPSDVALLKRKGIVTNWLGDDEEVSKMVNKMGKNVYISREDFQYKDLYKQLNDHYHTPWHKWKAKLKQDYFNSPWSLIAFLAAFADKTKLVLKRKITIGNAEEATDDCLVASLSEKLRVEHHLMSPQSCIFKVPARLREINENAYIPHAVSIGPLLRNNSEQLKAMENYKVHYLNAFLRRRPSITLKDYVNMLRGLEEEARECYAEEISLTNDEFVEMMILMLWEAGVKLSPAPDDRHALDIKFENGKLEIPTILVDDETELHLRNLIAYEQCQGCNTYIADYAAVIDNLIDSPKDVELLKRKGVIINGLGDDEEVSNMFNKIVKNVYMSEDFYYSDLYEKVNDYYENPWRKWKAKLKHDYFNTPWSTIAFSAAAVGVICTIIEAVNSFKNDTGRL
ncbi:hypothetical protein Syun_011058 [Stephania yunnanensis]|uniref:Uncharacterized protein n=1 Tax=Stephania yunnanensis TaxID=152371 RepID=A0AAP0JWT9_9MAGN